MVGGGGGLGDVWRVSPPLDPAMQRLTKYILPNGIFFIKSKKYFSEFICSLQDQ